MFRVLATVLVFYLFSASALGQLPSSRARVPIDESDETQATLRSDIGSAFGEARQFLPWLLVAIAAVSIAVLFVIYLTRKPVRLVHTESERLREPDRNEKGEYLIRGPKQKARHRRRRG